MHVEPHRTPEQLRELTDRQRRASIWRRLRSVTLAAEGFTAAGIAAALGCTERAVQVWVRRYNEGGPDALVDRGGRGPRPRVDRATAERLRARLDAGPTPADGACTLRGPEVRRILRDEFGVELGRQATYDLLHRIGYEPLMPRPTHRKSDPEAQAAFKKGLVAASGRSSGGIRASGSRSGSATRPASGSRAR
jgi:transposase